MSLLTVLFFTLVYATGFESLSSVPLSYFIDVQLMLVLAQISATFIAITAGFYTTKIISIVNEKSRINARIKEYETESEFLRKSHSSFQKKINDIHVEKMNNRIEWLKDVVVSMDEPFASLDDLGTLYQKYIQRTPSEEEMKALESKLPVFIEASNQKKKQDKERYEKIKSHKNYPTEEFFTLPPSKNADLINAMEREKRQEEYNELIERRDSSKLRSLMLDEMTNRLREELNTIMYPEHIRFGFCSFIIFAVLGVIIPLTYGSWGEIILQYHAYTFPINALVLILFGIGLSFNLTYIYLELRVALEPQLKESTSDTQSKEPKDPKSNTTN